MPEERRQWHLEKSINVGHILTTIALALAAFSWGSNLEQRVNINEQSVIHLTRNQDQQNNRIHSLRTELREDLRDISNKLDRLIESQSNK